MSYHARNTCRCHNYGELENNAEAIYQARLEGRVWHHEKCIVRRKDTISRKTCPAEVDNWVSACNQEQRREQAREAK